MAGAISTGQRATKYNELRKSGARPWANWAMTSAVAGAALTYRLTVRNESTAAAPGPFRVIDTLPAGLRAREASGTGWQCSISNGVVRCSSDASIPARDSLVVQVQVDVEGTATGSLTNCATLEAPNSLRAAGDARACHTVAVTPAGTLQIRKTAMIDTLRAGQPATWRVVVRNIGAAPSRAPVQLVDSMPAAVVPSGASGDGFVCRVEGTRVVCERTAPISARRAHSSAGRTSSRIRRRRWRRPG
jgi:uncharacterized repeat protein (TIGR01451 family)